MENRKDELNRFKSEINLAEYACATHGFTFDKRHSSRCSVIVRHPNGDKLIITRKPNRHYVYFNAKGNDSGTILDFIQARRNVSLGNIRRELRAFSSSSDCRIPTSSIQLEPSKHDAARVLRSWIATKEVKANNDYLSKVRRIPFSIVSDPCFAGQIRTDSRNNVLFAHRTIEGDLCGFEKKNQSFTGFSPGGIKSLFRSNPAPNPTTAIFCETAIDALSVAAVFGVQQRQFFSTAGHVSQSQMSVVIETLNATPSLENVWLAFDNDQAGMKLAKTFLQKINADLPDLEVQITLPEQSGCDWNDQLRDDSSPSPAMPPSI